MEEWKEYKLGDVVNILDYKRVPLSSKERNTRKGCYPYYGAQGIIDYIDDYIFDGTYLLIAEDGENLKSQKQDIAQLASGKYWVNNHAHIVESNGMCDIRYLCYILNKMDLSGYITGSAQPKLNQANMSAITINLPSLLGQKKIADFLSSLDDKIEVNRRINENLEQQAQALFKSWFVDFEPFKDGEFVESELGMIPKGWRVETFGEIMNITSGKRPAKRESFITNECNVPLVGASGIMGYTSSALFNDEILVTGRVGTHGVVQRFNYPCWPSDNTLVIKSDYYEYSYQILCSIDYACLNRGSTQPLITQTDIKNQLIKIPPQEVISEYEEFASALMKVEEKNRQESRRLASLRDTLLPRLMSGEIRVDEINVL